MYSQQEGIVTTEARWKCEQKCYIVFGTDLK